MSRAPRSTDDGDAGRLLAGALPAHDRTTLHPSTSGFGSPPGTLPAGASGPARAGVPARPGPTPVGPAPDGRLGPLRHALDVSALRDPGRLAAVAIIAVAWAVVILVLIVRSPAAGVDEAAYWHAARSWLAGGDPYHPTGPWWPYVYAPWLLPLFVPWALLPWAVASTLWSGVMLGLFLATVIWAYRRRPLATAVAFLVLSIPIGIVIGTGNVALYLVLGIWATRWLDDRSGGLLWALATAMKWIPGAFLLVLRPRARRWGLVAIAIAAVLSLLTWRQTLEQIQAVAAMGVPSLDPTRSLRLDHLVFLWATVPWLWEARPSRWPARVRLWLRRTARRLSLGA